jgi:hypothetical protein
MKIDVYGKFQIEVVREGEMWVAYKSDAGKRVRLNDLMIPSWLDEAEIVQYLDDHFHEAARPGQTVKVIE